MCEEKIIAELVDNQICDFGGKLEFDRGGGLRKLDFSKKLGSAKNSILRFWYKNLILQFWPKTRY